MDTATFKIHQDFWNRDIPVFKGVIFLEEFNLRDVVDQLLQLSSITTLIITIFVEKLRMHPVPFHCLFVLSLVFLFGLSLLLANAAFPAPKNYLLMILWLMMLGFTRVRTIWATTYLNYVTVYLCLLQLIFLIGSFRLSKLFKGFILHFSLIVVIFISRGSESAITIQCMDFPITSQNNSSSTKSKLDTPDPKTQAIQFYFWNTLSLILILITNLITKTCKKMARSNQVHAESEEEVQPNGEKNSFWVFIWFGSLITLRLLAALNMTLETFNFHPSLAFFSHFILCQPGILSQTAILLAAWFSGLSNS